MRHNTTEPITPAEWEAQRPAREREVIAILAMYVDDEPNPDLSGGELLAHVEGLARLRLTALQRHRIYEQVRAAAVAHELNASELLDAIRCGLERGESVVRVFLLPLSERSCHRPGYGTVEVGSVVFDPGSRW